MVKIGLISDTHVPSMGPTPPAEVLRAFEGVELILHAGDLYTYACIEWLQQLAPVEASSSAFAGVGEGMPRVSDSVVVEAGGHVIGLVHKLELTPLGDEVFPGELARWPARASLPDEVADVFGRPVDIVVFGYTHEAMVEEHAGILFVNPGSPNMRKQSMVLGTVALLDIAEDGTPSARSLDLADFS